MNSEKSLKLENFLIIAVIISLAFENFELFKIAGGSFKPTQVIAIAAIVCIIVKRGFDSKNFLWCVGALILPLFPIYRINELGEFFKTYLNYAVIVMFVCFALPHMQKAFCRDVEKYLKCFNIVVGTVCVLGIIQFVMMNAFDIFFLDGIFGTFEFHPNSYGQEDGMYRAFSVFHEPSYFGWVCDIALAINLAFKSRNGKKEIKRYAFLGLLIISIFVSLSSSAIWIMVALIAINLLIIEKMSASQMVISILAVAVLVFAVVMFDLSFITDSMSRLFTETNVEGTSAYERIISPIEYIKKTMENFPIFGRGMGQEGKVDAVGIIGLYSAVNNSVLGIIVTLGLTSIIFYAWLLSRFFGKRFNKQFRKERILLFAAIFGMYFSTGAFLSFDTFIFTIIVLLFLNSLKLENTLTNEQ